MNTIFHDFKPTVASAKLQLADALRARENLRQAAMRRLCRTGAGRTGFIECQQNDGDRSALQLAKTPTGTYGRLKITILQSLATSDAARNALLSVKCNQ